MDEQNSPPAGDEMVDPSSSGSAAIWFRRGRALYDQQHWVEAIPYFDQALQLNEHLIGAWTLRGGARYGTGDLAAALVDTEHALALAMAEASPNTELLALLLAFHARILFRLGRYTKALARFAELQRMGPLTAYQWTLLGDTHRELHQHKEALAAYRQALTHPERNDLIDSTTGAAWLTIVKYFLDQGAHEDALEASRVALMAEPEQVEAWGGQAHALLELKRPAEALAAANGALALDGRYAYGWLARARATRALNHLAEARDAYDHARTLFPSDDPQWKRLALEEGNMLLRTGHIKTAAQFLDVQVRQALGLPQRIDRQEDGSRR